MSNTPFRERPLIEQLAIEQALFSRLGDDVSTKNPGSLRSVADEDMVANYRATGAKSYDVHVEGQKVGTYSVRVSKEVAPKTSTEFAVVDSKALFVWVKGEDAAEMYEAYCNAHRDEFAEWYFQNTGEMPDGCEMVERVTEGRPSAVAGTTLRVDAGKVAEALGPALPTAMAGLLGGGSREQG